MFECLHNDVVYTHILTKLPNPDLWTMMNINRNLKELTRKFVDARAIQNINNVFTNIFADQIISAQQFKEFLRTRQGIIKGNFLVKSILGETFETSIDICNTLEYNTNQPFKVICGCYDSVCVIDNDDKAHYLKTDNFKVQNIEGITSYLQNVDDQLIFQSHQNEYWFDGQDHIKINNYFFVLNKIIAFEGPIKSIYHSDIDWLVENKFKFIKSQLYLHFIDYLQQYTDKMIPEYYYGGINELYYTIDEDTFLCNYTAVRNGQNCSSGSYSYDIIDDIRCFHYDKWNCDRTICDVCYDDLCKETNEHHTTGDEMPTTTLEDITIHHCGCSFTWFIQYLEGKNISEKIIQQYNLSGY